MKRAYLGLGSNLGANLAPNLDVSFSPTPSRPERLPSSPAENLRAAIDALARVGKLVAQSSLYETEPVGEIVQPRFLNAAAALETELDPEELLATLLQLEREFGRDRANEQKNGPRVLDLDILLMEELSPLGFPVSSGLSNSPSSPNSPSSGQSSPSLARPLIYNSKMLTLPHPRMAARRFVLAPLAEIAGSLVHPVLGVTITKLLECLPNQGANREDAVRRLTAE